MTEQNHLFEKECKSEGVTRHEQRHPHQDDDKQQKGQKLDHNQVVAIVGTSTDLSHMEGRYGEGGDHITTKAPTAPTHAPSIETSPAKFSQRTMPHSTTTATFTDCKKVKEEEAAANWLQVVQSEKLKTKSTSNDAGMSFYKEGKNISPSYFLQDPEPGKEDEVIVTYSKDHTKKSSSSKPSYFPQDQEPSTAHHERHEENAAHLPGAIPVHGPNFQGEAMEEGRIPLVESADFDDERNDTILEEGNLIIAAEISPDVVPAEIVPDAHIAEERIQELEEALETAEKENASNKHPMARKIVITLVLVIGLAVVVISAVLSVLRKDEDSQPTEEPSTTNINTPVGTLSPT